MRGLKCVCFLFITCIFYFYCFETIMAETEVADASESERKFNDVIELSDKEFKEAVNFVNKSKVYSKISDLLIHYTKHFLLYDKMTMRTKSGKITIPLSDKIRRNCSIMVNHVLLIEFASVAIRDGSIDFSNHIDRYRFIRNNTILMDEIVDHVNASFRYHKDIENPEKLRFYNGLKSDSRMLKVGHLYQSMKDVIRIQREATPSFSDVTSGTLFGSKSSTLNAEECLHLADYASTDDASLSIQFYEAALRRVDQYWALQRNKTQIVETVIEFYSQHGTECEHRIHKLKEKIEQIKIEKENAADDEDDDDDDDDDKEGKADDNQGSEGKNAGKSELHKTNAEEADKITEDINKIDEQDEKCFRKIIKTSSRLSANHDEL